MHCLHSCGEAWSGTGPIMALLVGMGIGQALTSVPSEIFKARGRADLVPRLHTLWTVSTLGLMALALPWGARAVACAWSVSTIMVAIYALARIPHVTPVHGREIVGAILPPAVSAALGVGAIFAFEAVISPSTPHANAATLGQLVIELAVGAVVYLAAPTTFTTGADFLLDGGITGVRIVT